ncbi:MAG: 16S rRNA (guanine(527)-N(7))-methyltransferase RsmG [Phycisphaerae bacterium]|nr:16S rRNA (guanine(527)-N(7))-methyltransferase RsmG [Phycisphaerae bacterium]|tara:strand:+ start:126 stop:839 length:714 start_codon:yes stop_codon:yes gene_type:complete
MSRIEQAPQSFLEAADALGIRFDDGDVERLGEWLALLEAANKRMNLTRITDHESAWHRHVLDSLTLVPYIMTAEAGNLLDIGSGGGAPGLPLAIILPDLKVGLLEATGKKANYLDETARTLGLENVMVINDRAEAAGALESPHREAWDVVSARAVGRLPLLLEYTVPFAREGGIVLAIKGEQAGVEVEESKRALHALHSQVVEQHRTSTGTIVLIEKLRKTARAYPRPVGDPSRNPL